MTRQPMHKHASLKNTLPLIERRESQQLKQQQTEYKIDGINEMQIMKKIQNKIKLKKKSVNGNQIQRLTQNLSDFGVVGGYCSNKNINDNSSMKELNTGNMAVSLSEIIERVLDKDTILKQKINFLNINAESVKQQLMKDSTFILCQINKGRKPEQIIVQRIENIISGMKLKLRIEEREKNIIAMMDERIGKLILMQKLLVK